MCTSHRFPVCLHYIPATGLGLASYKLQLGRLARGVGVFWGRSDVHFPLIVSLNEPE